MLAREDIQRQVTVAVVITVEEAALLVALQRQVGRVQVQHDLLGRFAVRFQEHLNQQFVEGCLAVLNLLVPARLFAAQL